MIQLFLRFIFTIVIFISFSYSSTIEALNISFKQGSHSVELKNSNGTSIGRLWIEAEFQNCANVIKVIKADTKFISATEDPHYTFSEPRIIARDGSSSSRADVNTSMIVETTGTLGVGLGLPGYERRMQSLTAMNEHRIAIGLPAMEQNSFFRLGRQTFSVSISWDGQNEVTYGCVLAGRR